MAKQKRPQYGKQAQGSRSRIAWVAGGVVAVVALVIGLSLGLSRPAETSTPPAAVSADRKAMGPTSAPVRLIEYGDFL